MTHKTSGIVLRTVKYGETSVIASILTLHFGLQSYIINGVRTSKKTGHKASLLQPASLLHMEVYHQEQKNMHRVKEIGRAAMLHHIFSDVVKNSVALLMMELLTKTLKQPEENADLFYFCEDCLLQLDAAPASVVANFPLFFILHLSHFFGFKLQDAEPEHLTAPELFLDLQEGMFTTTAPSHSHFLIHEDARTTATLLQCMHPQELEAIKMNHQKRRYLLQRYLDYFTLHISGFGVLKSFKVMQEVLG